MNKEVILMCVNQGTEITMPRDNSLAIARFSLAVDRRYSKSKREQSA